MKVIIRRACFRAEDFNEVFNFKFGIAYNIAEFVTIDIEDTSLGKFKETLRVAYASLGAEYEMGPDKTVLDQIERKQWMINQIISKTFKPY